ncbi:MAG TPA: winged helix-turn-helix domain-containing tetratricopeptide repeat protein [Rhizomicrobium sp.]|jgi:TolB-like protein/Flp pilus assembly protein TadD
MIFMVVSPQFGAINRVIYRFGQFTLDAGRRELRKGADLVAVEPQVFDLLRVLIAGRDRVVSRDELLEAVWNGRIVSEATLSSRINAARAAIDDSGARQALIKTLPRKGLRFVGAVEEVGAEATPPELPAAPWRGPRLPSLAVLPFANLSGDPAQDYFADGMSEEIITALSRLSGLFVIAKNSSFTYKNRAIDVRQIGQELGVGYVLEGSVRRGGERLRITGQLVDTMSGACLWSDRFDGDLADVFALQGLVSDSVAAVIEPTLQSAEIGRLRRDSHAKLDAYELLLRAYAWVSDFTQASMAAALDCLDQALAIDPDYALGLAAAAYCRAQCHFQGWAHQDETARARAVALAWRAVELAPGDAQVLWMAAFAIWNMDTSRRMRARELFARALLINPNSAMALVLSGWIEIMCGNLGEGRERLERAQHLNPRDPRGWLMAGARAILAVIEEDYAGALTWAERALAQNRRFAVALRVAAVAQVKLGQHEQARQTVEMLLEVEPGLTVSGFFARIPVPLERMARTYAEALEAAGLPP